MTYKIRISEGQIAILDNKDQEVITWNEREWATNPSKVYDMVAGINMALDTPEYFKMHMEGKGGCMYCQ